jgi:hypothetical protein
MNDDTISANSGPIWLEITDVPARTVAEVNRWSDYYQVQTWNFAVVENQLILTALCVHKREVRASMNAARMIQQFRQ